MSKEIAVIKNELPTIQELVKNVELYEKNDKLNFLLNQQPPKTWIKTHPYIKVKNEQGQSVPYLYLPIDKVEYLMRKIFKKYRIEILREGVAFNGVFVCVRVHYKDFITDEWDFHDGIGSINLQTKKGSSPADLQNINNGALSMAFPLAKTLAIKDACDMFGKLFGSDLNRRDTLGAAMDKPRKTNEEKLEEIVLLMQVEGLMISEEDRMNIERIIEMGEEISYNKAIKLLNSKLPKTKI